MDAKKLESLIKTLIKIAEETGNPEKYNMVIAELLKAEEIKNIIIRMHCGKPVVIFTNSEGGITAIDNE